MGFGAVWCLRSTVLGFGFRVHRGGWFIGV